MSILWEQLTQTNQEPPEVLPQKDVGRLGNGFAVLCPINATFDTAVRRNTDLIKERLEAGLSFSAVVESPPVSSNVSNESADSDAVSVPQALTAALNSIVDNVRPADVLIVYLCSSTPIDPHVVLSTMQKYPTLISLAVVVFDCPALVQISANAISAPDRRAVIIPPVLLPREHFQGHLTLKLLHAMLDLGDLGHLPSLVSLATCVKDVAMLIQGQAAAASRPWSVGPLTSTAKATFIACVSQAISRDDATNEITVPDGRTVGGNLKRIIPSAKIRLVIEKSQSLVITFTPDKAQTITVDRAQLMLDEACAACGNIEPPIVSYVSHDGRMHCSVNQEQTYIIDAMLNGSFHMQDPDTGAAMRWLYLGVSFKYEVVTSYREFLLMDAIARLHVQSSPNEPWRQIAIEDLGLAVVVASAQTKPSEAVNSSAFASTTSRAAPIAEQQNAPPPARSATPPQSTAAPATAVQPAPASKPQPAQQEAPLAAPVQPAPAAQAQPQQQPVAAAPAPQLGADMLAVVRMMIDDKVREAVATERHDTQSRLAEQQRLFDQRLREAEADFSKRLQSESEARTKLEQKLASDVQEIRLKAADHSLVERVLNDIHAQIATLKQQQSQFLAASQGRIDDVDKDVRALKSDFAAVVNAVDLHDNLLQQQKSLLVGLEQRQESAARGIGSHNEIIDALRDFSGRVKVVEVAIDRLHSGVASDMTVLSQRMMGIEGLAIKATEAALHATQQMHQATMTPAMGREVEAIASHAANTAVMKGIEQLHRRCERLDEAVTQLRQQDELLQRRAQLVEGELQDTQKAVTKAGEDAVKAAQLAATAAVSSTSAPPPPVVPTGPPPQVTAKLNELEAAVIQVHSQQGQLNNALTLLTEDVNRIRSTVAATKAAPVAAAPQPDPLGPSNPTSAVDTAQVTQNTADIKDLRNRVQQLELQGANVQHLLDSDVARENALHEIDLRVDALEAQVHAVKTSASSAGLARQSSRAL